jgi:hypothetical protein
LPSTAIDSRFLTLYATLVDVLLETTTPINQFLADFPTPSPLEEHARRRSPRSIDSNVLEIKIAAPPPAVNDSELAEQFNEGLHSILGETLKSTDKRIEKPSVHIEVSCIDGSS